MNPKFHIPKILLHPSTLNPKFRLVNHRSINVIYPSLKMKIKVVSVNMKIGTMNAIFVRISHKSLTYINNFSFCIKYYIVYEFEPVFDNE